MLKCVFIWLDIPKVSVGLYFYSDLAMSANGDDASDKEVVGSKKEDAGTQFWDISTPKPFMNFCLHVEEL